MLIMAPIFPKVDIIPPSLSLDKMIIWKIKEKDDGEKGKVATEENKEKAKVMEFNKRDVAFNSVVI